MHNHSSAHQVIGTLIINSCNDVESIDVLNFQSYSQGFLYICREWCMQCHAHVNIVMMWLRNVCSLCMFTYNCVMAVFISKYNKYTIAFMENNKINTQYVQNGEIWWSNQVRFWKHVFLTFNQNQGIMIAFNLPKDASVMVLILCNVKTSHSLRFSRLGFLFPTSFCVRLTRTWWNNDVFEQLNTNGPLYNTYLHNL